MVNMGKDEEAIKFLERDFDQSFQQMRHYDAQIFSILKYMFTAYSVLIGIALGVYQFSLKENHDLSLAATAALTVGLVFGIFMLALSIRNRVYFVLVTRYINEHRNFFLCEKPLGFENLTKMYTNHTQPPYFNWQSSQAWMSYIIAALNSILLMLIIFISSSGNWGFSIIISIFLFIAQLCSAIGYLKHKENKSASKAVFGSE